MRLQIKYLLLGLTLCLCHFLSIGQQNTSRDSLWKVYKNKAMPDTSRLKAIHEIVKSYIDSKPDSAIFFAELELELAQTTQQKKFEAKAINAMGVALVNKKDFTKALSLYLKALEIREEINDRDGVVQIYNNLSNLYETQGISNAALEFWSKRLIKLQSIPEKKFKHQRGIADCLYQIGTIYNKQGENIKALENYQKSLSAYQHIKDTINITYGFMALGGYYDLIGNLPKALETCQKGLVEAQKLQNKKGISAFLDRMGELYKEQGNNEAALECYQKSLAIVYTFKDDSRLSFALRQIGNIYSAMHNDIKALECYNKVISLAEANKDGQATWWMYQNIGEMFRNNKDYPHALEYFQKVLSLSEKLNEKMWVANMCTNMGTIYRLQGDIPKALEYQLRSKQLVENEKGALNFLGVNMELARDYKEQKNYQKAKFYCEKVYSEIKQRLDVRSISDVEQLSSQIDSALGNYKEAYYHYQQYIVLRDKLNSEEVRKAATKEKFQSEYDKQKAEEKAEQDKKDAIVKDEKRKQKLITWSVVGGLFLVLIFAGFIFRSLRVTRKQKTIIEEKNKEVEEKNKDILDSIHYAKRIQTSLLPTEKYIERILNKENKSS